MSDSLGLTGTIYGAGPDGSDDGSDNGSDVGPASTVFSHMLDQRGINKTTTFSSISTTSGRVDPNVQITALDPSGYAITTGTAAQLIPQLPALIKYNDGTETLLMLPDNTLLEFATTPQCAQFLQCSAAPTPQSFAGAVDNAYQQELGRVADPIGLSQRENFLASGHTEATMRLQLAQTPEAVADIQAIYQHELGRTADQAGLAANEDALAAAGGSLTSLETSIAASPEAAGDIQGMFQQELGRAADPAGLAGFQAVMASGGSLATVRSDIATSAEETSDVQALYQGLVGRDASPGELGATETQLANGTSLQTLRDAGSSSAEATSDISGFLQQVTGGSAAPQSVSEIQSALQQGVDLHTVEAIGSAATNPAQPSLWEGLVTEVEQVGAAALNALNPVAAAEAAEPLTAGGTKVDVNWLIAQEDVALATNGFIPVGNDGDPLENSGVTIGYGVDLEGKTEAGLKADGVDADTLRLLLPYLGLKTYEAAAALQDNPLTLTADQATQLTQAVLNENIQHVAGIYDAATDPGTFEALPADTQTAIADIGYQYYSLPKTAPVYWSYITTGQWSAAVGDLNNFGDESEGRRQREARLIQQDIDAGTLPQ